MEYTATIQNLGQAQAALDLNGIRERAAKNIERMTIALVLAMLVSVPFFQGGMAVGDAIIRGLGHLSYVQESAQYLGAFYALASIPLILYVGAKKSTRVTLVWTATVGSILGTLFYLSLC